VRARKKKAQQPPRRLLMIWIFFMRCSFAHAIITPERCRRHADIFSLLSLAMLLLPRLRFMFTLLYAYYYCHAIPLPLMPHRRMLCAHDITLLHAA